MDPKDDFFDLFLDHWHQGSGRGDGARGGWTAKLLLGALNEAGSHISDNETVRNWYMRENLPGPQQKEGILRVFFPGHYDGSDQSQSEHHARLSAAWEAARAARKKKSETNGAAILLGGGAPGDNAREPERPAFDWSISPPNEFPGLVEIELQQPDRGNTEATYVLRAALRFGTAERPWERRRVKIALKRAHFAVKSAAYLVVQGSMIGERFETATLKRSADRGVNIAGPHDERKNLDGDPIGTITSPSFNRGGRARKRSSD